MIHKFMVVMNINQAPQGLISAVWFPFSSFKYWNTANDIQYGILCSNVKILTNETVYKSTF